VTSKWPIVFLRDIANIQGGYAFKSNEYRKSGHYLICIANVIDNQVLQTDDKYVDLESDPRLKRFELMVGDLLMTLTGNIGRTAIVNPEILPAALNQRVARIHADTKVTSNEFLQYLFNSEAFIQHILGAGHGAAQQNVSTKDLESFRFSLPPLDEQKRIVAKLDEAMACVDAMRAISKSIVNLQMDYLNSLFHENFTKNRELPVTTLGQVCQISTGKKDVNQGSKNGKYPFFTCAKIPSRSDEYSFDTEAILLAGNGVNIGQAVYYSGKFEVYQRTYVLSDFEGIDVQYLSAILDFRLRAYLRELSMGNTIPYIKMGMLQDFPIPLPSLDDQKIIVRKLTSTFSELDRLKNNIETQQAIYKQLISSMLSSAFAGEL
jgi:type I restriction enzyme S subunit